MLKIHGKPRPTGGHLGNIGVGGTLNMSNTGKITNTDRDYTFDDTALWAYPSGYTGDRTNKDNASILLDFEKGKLKYDAMVYSLYNYVVKGDPKAVDSIQSFAHNFANSGASDKHLKYISTKKQIINVRYLHQFGNDMINYGFNFSASMSTNFETDATLTGARINIIPQLVFYDMAGTQVASRADEINNYSIPTNGSMTGEATRSFRIPDIPKNVYYMAQLNVAVVFKVDYNAGTPNPISTASCDMDVDVKKDLSLLVKTL